jgi:hypothetical protein
MTIKRYDLQRFYNTAAMKEAMTGAYVKIEDVRELIADAERFRMLARTVTCVDQIENLYGDVVSLRLDFRGDAQASDVLQQRMRDIVDKMLDQYE